MKRLGHPPYACLITRGQATSLNFESDKKKMLETIRHASADGVGMIQIREKALPTRLLFELVSAAVEILSGTPTLVLVNDRADVAVAAGADGVHLAGNSIPPDVVRRVFGRELVIGVSTHTVAEAETAAASGANYILFGPVFETPGKNEPVGLSMLNTVTDRLGSFPVIVLGGVDENNFDDAIGAGAAGVAAIRALNENESRVLICDGLAAKLARAL